jgi:nicotinamide riboside kinase
MTMNPLSSGGFKIAFIGTHGVGKTTLCYGLAARLKRRDISLEIVHEVARRCPLPINEETSVAAQSWILHTQIAEELTAAARYPVVICDRSVLDNYVYLLIAAGRQQTVDTLVDHWLKTYDLLVRVPVVTDLSDDGFRATDPAFQRAVDERVQAELSSRQLPALHLDHLNRDGWLELAEREVVSRLQLPQLSLPELDSGLPRTSSRNRHILALRGRAPRTPGRLSREPSSRSGTDHLQNGRGRQVVLSSRPR